jgi:hypothetical protein
MTWKKGRRWPKHADAWDEHDVQRTTIELFSVLCSLRCHGAPRSAVTMLRTYIYIYIYGGVSDEDMSVQRPELVAVL